MKALSLKQPWAAWVAFGHKTIETRRWKTRHRGEILICASQSFDPDARRVLPDPGSFLEWAEICHGKALAVVTLISCRPMEKRDEPDAMCKLYTGAYAWLLEDARPLREPFPVRGFPGVFEVEVPEGMLAW